MSPYAVIVTGYAVVLAGVLALHLLAAAGRAHARPLGEVLHAALAHPVGRWAVLAGWLWVGFHFLAR